MAVRSRRDARRAELPSPRRHRGIARVLGPQHLQRLSLPPASAAMPLSSYACYNGTAAAPIGPRHARRAAAGNCSAYARSRARLVT